MTTPEPMLDMSAPEMLTEKRPYGDDCDCPECELHRKWLDLVETKPCVEEEKE